MTGQYLSLTVWLKENVDAYNDRIKEIDDYFNYLRNSNHSKEFIAEKWQGFEDEYREYRKYLNLYYRNPYIFDKKKTENIMDYSDNRKSFWKYQWKTMQDDTVKFYNIK